VENPPAGAVRLRFLGAAGTVTGSRYLLEALGRRVLVDCGLFQGTRALRRRNWEDPPFDPRTLDCVLLTHAHVDHCAYLPRLVQRGYAGPVYATPTTIDLVGLVLPDSAHLQEEDAEHANRHAYARHDPALPLYTAADAQATLGLLRPLPYHELREVLHGVAVRPGDAGHILGSANLTVQLDLAGGPLRIAFSGDVGRYGRPILNDPEPVAQADYVLCESTYGDRLHPPGSPLPALAEAVRALVARGGVMVVPAFAIGRTQELLYALRQLAAAGQTPLLPVYVDSPMAIAATRIFGRHPEDQDPEARALLADGTPPLAYPDLHVAATRDESIAINGVAGPAIVVSASGMATGGRVLHHLARRLPDERNMVLLVGYQAEGTRGRSLQDGATELKIHGQTVPVRAEVRELPGFSAHGDQGELMRWLGGFRTPPRQLFLTHGDDGPRAALAGLVRQELGWRVGCPQHLELVALGPDGATTLEAGVQPPPTGAARNQADEA
jgi:metallo-beta-lactamase family protein